MNKKGTAMIVIGIVLQIIFCLVIPTTLTCLNKITSFNFIFWFLLCLMGVFLSCFLIKLGDDYLYEPPKEPKPKKPKYLVFIVTEKKLETLLNEYESEKYEVISIIGVTSNEYRKPNVTYRVILKYRGKR